MGSSHSKKFLNGDIENGVLTAICDLKTEKMDKVKALEGADGVATFTDYKEMFASGLIDAVIVAVPHYDHPRLTIEALEAGLHVVCEKPAGVYTKQVKEMNAVAAKSDKLFTMMFNQRTNCVYRKMHEMVANGDVGEIKRINWLITDWYRSQFYYDSGDWRATWKGEGGGVLFNQCPHQLDLLQWVTGMMPKRIHAFCHEGMHHNIEVEDDVTAYAEYENGATAVFITTTGDHPGTNRFEVTGTKGKLIAEGKTLTFYKNKEATDDLIKNSDKGFVKPDHEVIEFTYEDAGPQHKGVTQAFVNHLIKGTPMIAEGPEGINGLSISNAMMLSSWKNDFVECKNDGEEFWAELQKRIEISKNKEKKVVVEKVEDLSNTYTSKA